jgi:putative inorganic carbon (HCO3(-)) transporter
MRTAAERTCVALLLAYLAWLPMPFGSVVDRAFLPLVVPPIALCAVASLLRRTLGTHSRLTPVYRIWTAGAILFLIIVALQLVPLPDSVLAFVSPGSSAIWTSSERVVSAAGVAMPRAHPISVDPEATRRELFRLIALFATVQAAALLITTNTRRLLFAAALVLTATFETLYGAREAAMRRYAIWGWVNRLIFDRVTGTFVNPNHFASYVALALPFTFFIAALAWRQTGTATMPMQRRIVLLFEKALPMFGISILLFAGCVAGILLAQSRGALASTFAGFIAVAVIAAQRERHPHHVRTHVRKKRRRSRTAIRVFAGVAALAAVTISLILFLGYQRTVARFEPNAAQRATLVGRVTGIGAAFSIWRRFPLFGSGFGTFGDVVSMVQKEDLEHIYDHAHDDYAEVLATTGVAGFTVSIASLLAGVTMIARDIIRRPRESGSWRRRAFEIAALWSLIVGMAHALYDFNFFIPANAATLAAIAGACAAPRFKETREERERAAVPGFA